MVENYQDLLEEQHFVSVARHLEELSPPEGARFLADLSRRNRAVVFRLLEKDHALAIFENLEPDEQGELLEGLKDDEVIHIVREMSADDRARLLNEMPAKVAKQLLRNLPPDRREATLLLLGYAPGTAGRIMIPEYISLRAQMTVAEALDKIRRVGLHRETIYTLYVVDEGRCLKGVLSLRDLVLAAPEQKVADLVEGDVISVRTDTDQEIVARLIEQHDLLAIPVVDLEDRLVGIVTVDDALDVLDRETTEDFQRLAAMTSSPATGEQYFRLRAGWRIWRRLPWLLALAVAGTVSGSVIAVYEDALTTIIALAFFIPMIMDTAGNTGAQAVTLAVRGLATGEIQLRHFGRILRQELNTGFFLGTAVGAVGFSVAFFKTGDLRLAGSVAAALLGTVLAAGTIGIALPFALRLIRIDPAVASAPLITTVGDAVGLILYFTVARFLYHL